MWVTKLLISQVKKKDFLPQNDQIWPKIGIIGQFGPGHAGFFSALLVGRLVVVARGLYLARHLFTFIILISHVLGLGFSSCTSFLLKHRHNQVILGHQIVLRHKYCESPAQMRLVFKYVEYLPVMKVGV